MLGLADDPRDDLSDLKGAMDIVLIDAPCTGTGTWRRRPDAKWRLKDKQLAKRIEEQTEIIAAASAFVKPGGRLVGLEFTVPPNPIMRAGYLFYFHHVLPVVGRIVSGHPWAYTYLPESVKEFPGPAELGALFETVGFTDGGWTLLTGGIVALHWGSA